MRIKVRAGGPTKNQPKLPLWHFGIWICSNTMLILGFLGTCYKSTWSFLTHCSLCHLKIHSVTYPIHRATLREIQEAASVTFWEIPAGITGSCIPEESNQRKHKHTAKKAVPLVKIPKRLKVSPMSLVWWWGGRAEDAAGVGGLRRWV